MTVAAPKPDTSPLARPVITLYGVGPERAAQLARLEVRTVEDLLLLRPRRHEDRRQFRAIRDLAREEPGFTRGRIVAQGVKWFRQRTKSLYEFVLEDGTGRLHCQWWNCPFLEKQFALGQDVVVFGRVRSLKPRTMDHPETEVAEPGVEEDSIQLGRITPIYPLTEGLPQRWLRSLIWRTLKSLAPHLVEPWPEWDRGGPLALAGLPSRPLAIQRLHFPEKLEEVELARRRLALDEFLELQLQIQLRRRNFQTRAQGLPCAGDNHLIKPFLARLGFKLTEAQTRVLRELRKDMSGAHPMRRLLQGDVGSGKTVVAACCALMALESGCGVALMVPTEILAEQHFQTFSRWLKPLGVPVRLRTASHKSDHDPADNGPAQAKSIDAAPRASGPALTIGTHALLTEGFELPNLGLVIIDEQHKFGVSQREQLVRKGRYPHLLVMTATPIPRTLGLTLYGDLDVSVINELPPGRGTIRTFVRTMDKLPKVWEFIRSHLAQGRQAYIIYPRVEETSGNEVKAAVRELENVKQALAPHPVGLLHGRLRPREKEQTMEAFHRRTLLALLATALVEVGVDVPNATVMLIENAEQFGLAQLHQLRGRIGRGCSTSYCILVAADRGKDSRARLKVLEETTDGFKIAEADLRLRGPGELLGQQQSGLPRFRFGDLVTDGELVRQARELAARLLAERNQ